MCGIAGLVGRLDGHNAAAVEAMSGALAHRGPDGHATWASTSDDDGWGCLLAHRRLSVLDLSSAADQPMVHPGSGQALVYNGELYDYRVLRDELVRDGDVPVSTGDTEVLLRLLDRHGPAALPRVRGMFALALWDPRTRSLLLARDPLGIKPLYVATNPDPRGSWSVAFASEVRALLRSGLVPRRLDPDAVASTVWNGFVAGPGTAVRGVELLDPGTWRRVGRPQDRVEERRFWSLPDHGSTSPVSVEQVREELRTCVAQHLVSDVPLGVFLSSGVDSGAVANLAQAALTTPLRTFTLSFDEPEHSEGEAAQAIAAAIGTDHVDIVLRADDFGAGLTASIDTLDQPTFDGLNTMYVSRAVRAAGVTVALTGTGGDELFGGYSTFRDLPRVRATAGHAAVPTAARRALSRLVRTARPPRGPVPAQTRWAKLPRMLEAADDLVALYQLSYALFLPEFQSRLLRDGLRPLPDGLTPALATRLRQDVAGQPALPALSRLEQRMFLGERLLRDSDAAAMAVSLELRLPLVDARLTEAVDRLPDDVRFSPVGRKALLRTLGFEGLDAALFDRPKRGFVLPYDAWLRGPLGRDVEETLGDPAACERAGLDPTTVRSLWVAYQSGAPGLYWSRIWALYALVSWSDRHGVAL